MMLRYYFLRMLTFAMNVFNIFRTSTISLFRELYSSSDIYPRLFDNNTWYSNSALDPIAICKNQRNSPSEFLPHPSAMLEGTETEHLRNCDVKPYISVGGKLAVILYILTASLWLLCQICKDLKSIISKYMNVFNKNYSNIPIPYLAPS